MSGDFGDRSWLRARARRLLGARLSREVESTDLAHDVLLRAQRYAGKTPSRAARRGLLDRILANLVRSMARRRPALEWEDLDRVIDAGSPSPSSVAEKRERARNVRRALDVLDERSRRVVELRLFGERSFAELGTDLGISEGNARVIFHRAVRTMRTHGPPSDADPER